VLEFTHLCMKTKLNISYLLQVLFFSLLYYLTADLGLRMDAVSGFATLFWLPTGISLAILLLFGTRYWPSIITAAFLVNYVHGALLPAAVAIAVGSTAEALVGVFLLKRFTKINPSLEEVKDVVGLLLFAALGSTLISATIGATSLMLSGLMKTSYLSMWSAWWLGDLLSNLLIAPFLLVWSRIPHVTLEYKRLSEGVLWIFTIVAVGAIVFGGVLGINLINSPLTYIVFPPLIWAALRYGQREVVTGMFFLSMIAVWGTIHGYGPFVRESVSESLLYLQSFMVILSVSSMLLAAAVTERKTVAKRKDDFISFASHELKTPLTSIKVLTQILQRSVRTEKGTNNGKYLDRLEVQVDKLTYLINDMLDLSKIQNNSLELQKESFYLKMLVKEVVDTMQETTKVHRILIKGKELPQVYADRDRLSQVMLNLLSNAIKYSPKGKKIIINMTMEGSKVVVTIRDYGIGIPPELQEKIFDRFYRVSTQNSQTIPGLGIGLYLSSMIVKRHGGEMKVKSTLGKGSTFIFSLPRST
jgi:signal transduction histidine kinase